VSIWQTVLIFVVAPLGGFGLLAVLVFAGAGVNHQQRYRPGRQWEHDPVWYVPRPEPAEAAASTAGRPALGAGAGRQAPPAHGGPPASVLDVPARTARGGADGEW
jgi:hypothetical protein